MNDNGTDPMLGDNPNAVVVLVPTDDVLWIPSYEYTSGNTSSPPDLLPYIDVLNTTGINDVKEGNMYQLVEPAQPQGEMDDIDRIIRREMERPPLGEMERPPLGEMEQPPLGEMEQPPLDINYAPDHDKICSTTHGMVDGLLHAMPKKDIPFEVIGAQPGHVVKVGLRYSTGAYYNTPVKACKNHSDDNDKDISFFIPKHNPKRATDSGEHFILELPVNSTAGSTFKFSLVFRCPNSCHKEYGKFQEIDLRICDQQGNVLKERNVPLRVCKGVKRDMESAQDKKSLDNKKPLEKGKKRRGGKKVVCDKEPATKRVKQEPEKRDQGTQTSTSTALPAFLSGSNTKLCCQAMDDERFKPLMNEIFKLRRAVLWKEGYKHDGLSVDPPDAD